MWTSWLPRKFLGVLDGHCHTVSFRDGWCWVQRVKHSFYYGRPELVAWCSVLTYLDSCLSKQRYTPCTLIAPNPEMTLGSAPKPGRRPGQLCCTKNTTLGQIVTAATAFIAKPPRLSVLKKTMTESLFAEFALPANRRSLSLLRGSKLNHWIQKHQTMISKTPRWPYSRRLNRFDAVSPCHLLMVKARGSSFIDYLEESWLFIPSNLEMENIGYLLGLQCFLQLNYVSGTEHQGRVFWICCSELRGHSWV